jgi:5-methylcytosine-specific restriction endonuclease McrA
MNDSDIRAVFRRDGYCCLYCGKDGLVSQDNWHHTCIDHFIPISKGGQDTYDNAVTSCHYCNAIKASRVFATIEDANIYIQKR